MYNYGTQRKELFTESGFTMFLKIRDNVLHHIKQAGAVRAQEAWRGVTGDTWTMLACLDRMVETNEITEVTDENAPGQYRVFVGVNRG